MIPLHDMRSLTTSAATQLQQKRATKHMRRHERTKAGLGRKGAHPPAWRWAIGRHAHVEDGLLPNTNARARTRACTLCCACRELSPGHKHGGPV